MSIEKAVEEALEHYNTPPPNESNTCDWIILPLLLAAGYARRDINSRVADNNGHFPDYTVLANNASCTWYVEAKAWNVTLEDRHAHQALNYANQNGRRWVVLTNGRTWNLYDNSIQGLVDAKRVLQAHLKDVEAITEFLETVGKQSVQSDQLEATVHAIKERQKAEQEAEAARKQARQAEVQAVQPADSSKRPLAHADKTDDTSDKERLNFWRMLRIRLQDKGFAITEGKSDWSKKYLPVDRRRGIDCYYYVVDPRQTKVEYVLDKPQAYQHIAQFLHSKQAEIEEAIGTSLQWMPDTIRQEYKIRMHIECRPFADADAEEHWPDMQEEMIRKMRLLQEVLAPLINAAEARYNLR